MRPIVFAAAVALALIGCQTKSEMRNLPSDAGTPVTYAAPFDKVKRACEDTLREVYFKIGEKDARFIDESRYEIIASKGLTAGTTGQRARIQIENQQTQCTVRVVVRSKIDSREAEPGDNAMAEDIHKKIAARVAK